MTEQMTDRMTVPMKVSMIVSMTEQANPAVAVQQWSRVKHSSCQSELETSKITPRFRLFCVALFAAASSLGLIQPGQAQQTLGDSKQRNHVQLSEVAQRAVTNEEVSVTLATEHRGGNPAELAQLANEDLAWATDLIDSKKSVTVVTGNYQTFPMYEHERQDKPTWQLVQEIVIRSQSIADVTDLLGQLQSRLQIRGTQFSITPETRRKVENELIENAMAAFHERAAVIGRSMPSSQYEIVKIVVDASSSNRSDYPVHARAMDMETMQMDTGAIAPTVEAGQATIVVRVDGSVVYP